jgi:RND family efflux transporter MFP subunit
VDVVSVGAEDHDGFIELSGTVEARHQVPLGFRVSGKVIRRLVDIGSAVAAGDPLALLDTSDLDLEAARAEAQRSLAAAELNRFRQLHESHVVSLAAVEDKAAAFKAADAQAALARNQVGYASLRAEVPGIVTSVRAEPGQVVAPGEPVFVLARSGEREVAVSVPESHIGRFHIGDTAQVGLWAERGTDYRGRLRELSAAADPITRTYAARVTIIDADARVNLGMTARARFQQKSEPALRVPLSAIFRRDDRTAVWVVNEAEIVDLRPVTVDSYTDAGALLSDGLIPGERVVVSGVHAVHPGEHVVIASPRRSKHP